MCAPRSPPEAQPTTPAPLTATRSCVCRADEPVIRFRNYTPRSEELQESTETVAKPVVPAVEEQVRRRHARPLSAERGPLSLPGGPDRRSPAGGPDRLSPPGGPGRPNRATPARPQVDTAEIIHNDATQEPLLNLAPKRANWDLKRDLEPQMKKLRSMTDRAIVQLIAKRVSEEQQSEGQGPDLALAAEQQRKAEAANDDD